MWVKNWRQFKGIVDFFPGGDPTGEGGIGKKILDFLSPFKRFFQCLVIGAKWSHSNIIMGYLMLDLRRRMVIKVRDFCNTLNGIIGAVGGFFDVQFSVIDFIKMEFVIAGFLG